MTLEDAKKILDEATQPQMQGKITRQGYARLEEALAMIFAMLEKLNEYK